MKNPFKRTKKTPDRKGEVRLEMARVVLDLPVAALKEGIDIHFDERGARPITPDHGPNLADLGVPWEMGYDPNFRGSFSWFLIAAPSYSWRGQTFGINGADLVKELGLDTPQGVEYKVNDDGRITWFFQERPTDVMVAEIVQGTQRQVERIMADYGRVKAFVQAGMTKKK